MSDLWLSNTSIIELCTICVFRWSCNFAFWWNYDWIMFPSSELFFCLVQWIWIMIQLFNSNLTYASCRMDCFILFQSCPSARWSARAHHRVCLHFGKGLLVGLSLGCRMNACPARGSSLGPMSRLDEGLRGSAQLHRWGACSRGSSAVLNMKTQG